MSKALELAKFGRETPPTGVVVGDTDTQTLSAKTFSDGPVFSGLNANGVPFLNASKVLSSSSTFVFDGTNIGLGIASPAATLHVNASGGGTIRASRSSVGGEYIQLDHDGTDGTLRVSGNNKLYLATNGSTRLTILGGGFVGVGIQAPSAVLHTQSSGLGDGGGIKLTNSGSGGGTFAVWPTATINSEGPNKLIFTSSSGNLLTLNGTTGNLGIGVDPSYKLHVSGDAAVTGKLIQSGLTSYPQQSISLSVGTSTWVKLFSITSPGGCLVRYNGGSQNSEEQGEFSIKGTYVAAGTQLTWSRQTYYNSIIELRVTGSNSTPYTVWALVRTTDYVHSLNWQVIEALNSVTLHNSTGETPGTGVASITNPGSNSNNFASNAAFNGNVGIGTYNPVEKLHVAGKVRVFDGGYPYIDLGVATDNYFRIIHDNPTDRLLLGKNSNAAMGIDGSGYVHFYTQGVAGSGGVNLTSADPFIRLTATGGTANKQKWDIRAISSSGSEALEFRTINDANTVFSTKLWIGNGGGVGIGTTSPEGKLEVKTSADGPFFIGRFHNGSAKLIYAYQSGSDGYLELRTGNDTTITKLSGYSGTPSYFLSNVGVGTIDPGERLSVDGNIRLIGNRALIFQQTSGVAVGAISFRNSSGTQKAAIGTYYNIADEGAIEFLSSSATNMILRSSGNLHIGATNDPGYRLGLYSDTTGDGMLVDVLSNPTIVLRDRGNSDTKIGTGGTAGLDNFYVSTYNINHALMIKGSNGFVGIGTNDPGERLTVNGSIRSTTNAINFSGQVGAQFDYYNGDMRFATNNGSGTSIMYFNAGTGKLNVPGTVINNQGGGVGGTSRFYAAATITPTSLGSGVAIYDIHLPNYFNVTDGMDIELYVHANPNGGGSGSYRQTKHITAHCLTQWNGAGYTPFLEWDSVNDYMGLGFDCVIFFQPTGQEFPTTVSSTATGGTHYFWNSTGVYLRIKVTGFNTSSPGHHDLGLIVGHRS